MSGNIYEAFLASAQQHRDRIAVWDGERQITYGELQGDKEVGPKLTQAEAKALAELNDTRSGLLEEYVSRHMLEGEAKAKNKTLEQWFQTDYQESVPKPTEDEIRHALDGNLCRCTGYQNIVAAVRAAAGAR